MEFWKPTPGEQTRIHFMEPAPTYQRHWVKPKYVCADCGHEQHSMDTPCDECKSVRVVSIKWVEDLIGPDWRDNFDGK
jgi:hypothetical protein